MISCKLHGGLGNYMFQLAVANCLAIKHNNYAMFNLEDATLVHKPAKMYEHNILRKIKTGTPELLYEYNEPCWFKYNKLPYKDGMLLKGYFQSEKYLDRDIVLDLYEIDEKTKTYIETKYGNDFTNTVSIHIRRNDYLTKPESYIIQDMDYYIKAMEHFKHCDKFLIFSDDIEWCRQHFKGSQFEFIQEEDYIDLWLMSMCNHNIIGNSTFSWWGAWLNQHLDKIVIAPKKWFAPAKNANTNDLIPIEWKQI